MASLGTKNVILIGLLFSALGCFGMVLVDTQTSYVFLACLLFVLQHCAEGLNDVIE